MSSILADLAAVSGTAVHFTLLARIGQNSALDKQPELQSSFVKMCPFAHDASTAKKADDIGGHPRWKIMEVNRYASGLFVTWSPERPHDYFRSA